LKLNYGNVIEGPAMTKGAWIRSIHFWNIGITLWGYTNVVHFPVW